MSEQRRVFPCKDCPTISENVILRVSILEKKTNDHEVRIRWIEQRLWLLWGIGMAASALGAIAGGVVASMLTR